MVGNHDVGFHFDMIDRKIERFNRSYNGDFVRLYQPKNFNDINFVIVNSMAFENDNCKFCKKAQKQLDKLNKTLDCLKKLTLNEELDSSCAKEKEKAELNNRAYSRPILLSHFPLYRSSDSICPNDIDSEFVVLADKMTSKFKPKYDCLSVEATKQLLEMTNPRLVFNGHTHFSCVNELHGVPEYTIASFSWRNIKTPSMLLVRIFFIYFYLLF